MSDGANTLPQLLTAICEELDEESLRDAAVQRHGEVTVQHREQMWTHLDNLRRLLVAAGRHDRNKAMHSGAASFRNGSLPVVASRSRPFRRPVLGQRYAAELYGYQPTEVLAGLQDDAQWSFTPEEYEEIVARPSHCLFCGHRNSGILGPSSAAGVV